MYYQNQNVIFYIMRVADGEVKVWMALPYWVRSEAINARSEVQMLSYYIAAL